MNEENYINMVAWAKLGMEKLPKDQHCPPLSVSFLKEYVEERKLRGEEPDKLAERLLHVVEENGLESVHGGGMTLEQLCDFLENNSGDFFKQFK